MRYIITENQYDRLLSEVLVGTLTPYRHNKPIEVYKNPPSIRNLASDARAVVDEEGNLFVADDGMNILHIHLLDYLREKGYRIPSGTLQKLYQQILPLQRDKSTNNFYLSEIFDVESFDEFKKLRKLLKIGRAHV